MVQGFRVFEGLVQGLDFRVYGIGLEITSNIGLLVFARRNLARPPQ